MIHEFTNLPPLTTEQANVVAAILTGGPTLIEMADAVGLDLAHFLDHYSSPEVRAHIRAARSAITDNVTIRLTEAAHTATQVLETLAQDTGNDKTERRRAATTILRAFLPRSWRGRCHRVREVTEGASAQDAFEELVRSFVQPSAGGVGESARRRRESESARDLLQELESVLRSHATGGEGVSEPSRRGVAHARDAIGEQQSTIPSRDTATQAMNCECAAHEGESSVAHATGSDLRRVREHASPSPSAAHATGFDPTRVPKHAPHPSRAVPPHLNRCAQGASDSRPRISRLPPRPP